MRDKIIELIGKQAGPTSIILTGVHGDEICGPLALKELLPRLKIQRGRVFVGYGNPLAIAKNVRQIDANLNRLFKPESDLSPQEKNSYEYERAQFLKKYLDQAEVLLDVHASYDPHSPPFIICEDGATEIAKYLPVNLIVSGFDAIEPGGTDYYMSKQDKIGICIECGYRSDPKTSQIAEKGILDFLIARGHISGQLTEQRQQKIRRFNLYLAKTTDFRLAKNFTDFAELEVNDLIGFDGNAEINAPEKCVILFAQNTKQVGAEAFLLGRKDKAPA